MLETVTPQRILPVEWLKEAYRLTRKDGAPGIDGVTAADYAENLEARPAETLSGALSHDQDLELNQNHVRSQMTGGG